MALNLRSWEKLKADEAAFNRYLEQPTATAEQLYEANFHLMQIRALLLLILYVLVFGATIFTLRIMGWV